MASRTLQSGAPDPAQVRRQGALAHEGVRELAAQVARRRAWQRAVKSHDKGRDFLPTETGHRWVKRSRS